MKVRARTRDFFGNQDVIAQRFSPGLASNRANRHTLEPAVFGNQHAIAQRSSPGLASNRATATCMRCKPSHPSPSAGQFRIPFNWLASSELRRIFCSDEGAGADSPIRHARRGGLGHVGRAVDIRRRGCMPVTRLKRKEQRTGFTAIRMAQRLCAGDTGETKKAAQRFTGSTPERSSQCCASDPFNRHRRTLLPAAG